MKRVLLFSMMLAMVSVVFSGCVFPWDYHDIRVKYDALTNTFKAREAQILKLGPENEALRRENDALNIQNRANRKIIEQLKGAVTSGAWTAKVRDFGDEVKQITVTPEIGPGEGLTVYKNTGTVGIAQDLLFASGSATVLPSGKGIIRNLANILMKPKYGNALVQVEGHTDRQPVRKTKAKFGDNWGLSALRACAVLRELAKAGVPESRLCGMFWGEQNNRVHNPPGQSVKANRRVEIRLLEK